MLVEPKETISISPFKMQREKLFCFLNSFIGKSKCCPLPEGDDQDVANSLAEFFNKIEKIRDGFNPDVKYIPTSVNCMSFNLNTEISEADVCIVHWLRGFPCA